MGDYRPACRDLARYLDAQPFAATQESTDAGSRNEDAGEQAMTLAIIFDAIDLVLTVLVGVALVVAW